MPDNQDQRVSIENERKPYAAPELIEHGEINNLVQTGFRIGRDALLISDSLT